jgi:hypothetical protein
MEGMAKSARELLKDNFARMINAYAKGRKPSLNAWATSKKLNVKRVQRAASGETGCSIDVLEELANGLGMEAWELLYPGMDEKNRPTPALMSPMAADIARMLDAIQDDEKKRKAHAIITQMLEFGDLPAEAEEAPAPASASPTHTPERAK